MSTQDTTLPPLPDPAFKRVCLKYTGGDTPGLYREGWVIVDLDAFSADQMRAAIAAQAQQPSTEIDEEQLKRLWANGAKAWAGVDAQALRDGYYPVAPQQAQQAQGVPAAWIRWEWNRSGLKSLVFEKPAELSLREEATGVVYDPLYAAPQAEPVQQAQGVPEDTLTAASLAAMAAYPKGHLWDSLDAAVCKRAADLLATAPQPEREPLSREQIEALPVWTPFVGLWPQSRQEIARAIEAAHGIGTKGGDKP